RRLQHKRNEPNTVHDSMAGRKRQQWVHQHPRSHEHNSHIVGNHDGPGWELLPRRPDQRVRYDLLKRGQSLRILTKRILRLRLKLRVAYEKEIDFQDT